MSGHPPGISIHGFMGYRESSAIVERHSSMAILSRLVFCDIHHYSRRSAIWLVISSLALRFVSVRGL